MKILYLACIAVALSGCSMMSGTEQPASGSVMVDPKASSSKAVPRVSSVLVTSASGKQVAAVENDLTFAPGTAEGVVVNVMPAETRQTLHGIGGAFTESSAFVVAHLTEEQRNGLMEEMFGTEGANFSVARVPVGSTDFSVKGKYSYADVADDRTLEHFSIEVDRDGFSRSEYKGIKDESYDLLPMITHALEIRKKDGETLKIVASPWTAPAWMKDINDWFTRGTPQNDYQGTGGVLKREYYDLYADYLLRYLDAYRKAGVDIWALTPVNEPAGNNGQWESMHFTPRTQSDWIKNHFGPKLKKSAFSEVKLLIYDQNRDHLEEWADTIYNDSGTAPYVHGAAIHWYESTEKVNEDILQRVFNRYPQYDLIHTEACIDNLGNEAPGGVLDPARYKESGWFDNDSFWWGRNATDWAYSATWPGVKAEDHPIYTPTHRYARNIIVSLNHGVSAWIDWNLVLDQRGGPNHVGNYCGAPVMIDTASGYIYYTPIYHILAQLSRTIRPGDTAVQVTTRQDGLDEESLYASAAINDKGGMSVQILNTHPKPVAYTLQVGQFFARDVMEGNSLKTVSMEF